MITMISGLIQSMILAHLLTVNDYALYGQCNTLIATVSGITVFGFADSIIYFCGINSDLEKKQKYLTAIFLFEIIFCVFSGILILSLKNAIVLIFENEELGSFIFLLAFFPLFINLSSCFSQLLFTENKVKCIAACNLLFSLLSLTIAVLITTFTNNPILLYLILMISLYILLTLFQVFCYLFGKKRFIKFARFDKTIVKEVLKYSVPLGITIVSTTLLKEFDKIIISNQCTSLEFATYVAVSKQLPITFFSAALGAQIIPLLVKSLNALDNEKTKRILHLYFLVGFVSSIILGFAVLCVSKQSLVFLYSEKYSDGIWVFIIYIFVDIFSFVYPGKILMVSGRTKELLLHSVIMLVFNIGLNVVLLKLIGIIGPALATLIVQVGALIVQTYRGMRINNFSIRSFIPWKHLMVCTLICVPSTIGFGVMSHYFGVNNIFDILIYGGLCCVLNTFACGFYLVKSHAISLKEELQ